jgi:hypothetical protein
MTATAHFSPRAWAPTGKRQQSRTRAERRAALATNRRPIGRHRHPEPGQSADNVAVISNSRAQTYPADQEARMTLIHTMTDALAEGPSAGCRVPPERSSSRGSA